MIRALMTLLTTSVFNQEIISVGDKIGFGFELGEADRYLIRGVSFNIGRLNAHRQRIHQPVRPALGFPDGRRAVQPDQYT